MNMYQHDTAAILSRIRQLQAQFEGALESGKTFEEVRTIYLEIKSLIEGIDQPQEFKMKLRNKSRENSAGGSYTYD